MNAFATGPEKFKPCMMSVISYSGLHRHACSTSTSKWRGVCKISQITDYQLGPWSLGTDIFTFHGFSARFWNCTASRGTSQFTRNVEYWLMYVLPLQAIQLILKIITCLTSAQKSKQNTIILRRHRCLKNCIYTHINNKRLKIYIILWVPWPSTDLSVRYPPSLSRNSSRHYWKYMYLSTKLTKEEVTLCLLLCGLNLNVRKHTQHNFAE